MILVQLRVALFNFIESCKVIFLYHRSPRFLLADLVLLSHYFFISPFRVSKLYLQKQGAKNIYQYGPTPLTTFDGIAKKCSILSDDTVYELGCGTGRVALWLSCFIGCKTVGIERIPTFINKANQAKKRAALSNVTFLNQDMFTVDYTDATVLYLYGTLLQDTEIKQLCTHLHSLKPGTKIITVSYPFTEYDDQHFSLKKQFIANYPWGKAEVYLNIRL